MTLYIPKWLFPNNLGDTLISTFIPKILKQRFPDKELTVVSSGKLYEIMKYDNNIDNLRFPTQDEINVDFWKFANINNIPDVLAIAPHWHPRLFSFWKTHHDFFTNHPSANIITVNFLLQLKLEELLFDDSYDFRPYCNTEKKKNNSDFINVGFVITTKLAGKVHPHPGCNGLGYRYKLSSWEVFCNRLREAIPNIKLYEFSEEYHNIGDIHVPYSDSYIELFNIIDLMDIGIMSDGGLHHAFNLRNIPIVLFQSNILSKVEFLKLGNAHYPEHLHLKCRKMCRSYYTEVFGGEDKSKTCKLECEDLDPKLLANYTLNIIKETF